VIIQVGSEVAAHVPFAFYSLIFLTARYIRAERRQFIPSGEDRRIGIFRGIGDPLALAVRAAINATSTPLSQATASNPTTPLDAQKLAGILHGISPAQTAHRQIARADGKTKLVLQG
jgi:hypothetical protein